MHNLIPIFKQHAIWNQVQIIIQTLNNHGEKAYLAGGCVRDALLNRIPKDFDIATSAKPDTILKLFPNSNKQGKAFGVIAVSCVGGQIEVATFRKEGPYKDGRHPQFVEFLSDKEDALRRDFTVNALFYDLKTNHIIDFVDGLKDLQKKIIRTVGEPEQRFQEDYLRILRAIRFSIKLDFKIEALTKKVLLKNRHTLLCLSKERVYEECLKTLTVGAFSKTLYDFKNLDLLKCFLGPLDKQNTNWDSAVSFWDLPLTSLDLLNNKSFIWIYAFYPLLISQQKIILNNHGKWNSEFTNNLKKWKFPVAMVKKMNNMFYDSCCILDLQEACFVKKLKIRNSYNFPSVLCLTQNYLKNNKLSLDPLKKLEIEFTIRAPTGQLDKPIVNGNDLKKLGVAENNKMAIILESLYDIQIEKQITKKTELITIGKNINLF